MRCASVLSLMVNYLFLKKCVFFLFFFFLGGGGGGEGVFLSNVYHVR